MSDIEELDNDGMTRTELQEFFKEKYPDLTELEMQILMGIHSKSRCATGIWCESELSDLVELIKHHDQQRLNAALAAGPPNVNTWDFNELVAVDRQMAAANAFNKANDKWRTALTAALAPDNSSVEEKHL